MASQRSLSVVRLPHVFSIGFVGDAHLQDAEACGEQVRAAIAEHAGRPGQLVCGLSNVVSAADLIFLEACASLSVPFRILATQSVESLNGSLDETRWRRVERVLHLATAVEAAATGETRSDSEYEAGLEIVRQSEFLLAVWDGKPESGEQGTGRVIQFAGDIGRPALWIDSATGARSRVNEGRLRREERDAELTFLNELAWPDGPAEAPTGFALAEAWLRKLDAGALAVAPKVRRLAAIPIVCTALAALVTAGVQRFHTEGRVLSGAWDALGAVLGLAAALLPAILLLNRRQALWVRIRTAAEITRSFLALWDTPMRYDMVGSEVLPELGGMVRSLNQLKSESGVACEVAAFKAKYVECRLLDQRRYFLRQSVMSAARGRRYRMIARIASVSAILMSALLFVGKSLIRIPLVQSPRAHWLAIATSALFQVATIAGALVVVNDCDRRERRYDELHRALTRWQVELEAFYSWAPVMQVVTNIERALLVELLEWRALLQNMKMPRN